MTKPGKENGRLSRVTKPGKGNYQTSHVTWPCEETYQTSHVTELSRKPLILSLFPGIGLLDRGFEDEGFTVLRGPDLLWGGDIRNFEPPEGIFDGVIGGPPCQDFSALNRNPSGYGEEMLNQFFRCVIAAKPQWWLMENVARVPDRVLFGYSWQSENKHSEHQKRSHER